MPGLAPIPKLVFENPDGTPLNGGLIDTFKTNTTTEKATYPTLADAIADTNANNNPVELDSSGKADIWLLSDEKYTFVVKDSLGTTLYTVDDIDPIGASNLFADGASIDDTNNNELIKFSVASSAVNEFTIGNAATTDDPKLSVTGADNDISMSIAAKGSAGTIDFLSDLTFSSPLNVEVSDSRTSTVDTAATFTSTTSGTPAAGIGTGIVIRAESGDESPSDAGKLTFSFTDIGAGTEDTDFIIQTRRAGAALTDAYKFRVTDTNAYLFTGAPSAERTISLPNHNLPGFYVQHVHGEFTTQATTTASIPHDDTIPQNTEGVEYLSQAITPKATSNILVIEVKAWVSSGLDESIVAAALFQDSTANALAAGSTVTHTEGVNCIHILHTMTAGTTSSTAFKLRVGPGAGGTSAINGTTGGRFFFGTMTSSILITEYTV